MFKRIAHLDLKGIHLKHEFFKEYFSNLQYLGYDALLVEYEDLFPFSSIRPAIDQNEVWSHGFLSQFLKEAEAHHIEIIPLQQCFGHLEYLFRWKHYRRYALSEAESIRLKATPQEDQAEERLPPQAYASRPRELNIVSPEAVEWFLPLLQEVLEAHPQSKWIHLGMDEAIGLIPYAEITRQNPLTLFLNYLDILCNLCERYGKHPIIWSDMLEDHIAPENLKQIQSFQNRVTLAHWNYFSSDEPQEVVRFAGWRCSKRLAEQPNSLKQPLHSKIQWTEDWPAPIAELALPYQLDTGHFKPFFQAAIWKQLGFSVWGSAGAGITQDRRLLPYYHWRQNNIKGWKQAIHEYGLDALLATQWGRSNSCSLPNLFPDVCWPVLQEAVQKESAHFFPEIPLAIQETLFFQIGKCRETWRIEANLIQQMESLLPSVQTHAYEWKTILEMLKILDCTKGIEETLHLVECYADMGRMPDVGWTQEKAALLQSEKQLKSLELRLRSHITQRYQGRAVEEWFHYVFNRQYKLISTGLEDIHHSINKAEKLLKT